MKDRTIKKFKVSSYEETLKVAKEFASSLKGGEIICLSGDLGTGKTAFTQGIAQALGIKEYITSPTFTIINEYQGTIPLYHFDVYRISDYDELFEIGFEEYIEKYGIVVIEWAEMIKDTLPKDCIWICIEKDLDTSIDTRIINIEYNEKV